MSDEPHVPRPSVLEIPCPNCGRPMLASWGSSCGACRPQVVASKTLMMTMTVSEILKIAPSGLTLGWLAVLRSPDPTKLGGLVELEQPRVALSRQSRGDAVFLPSVVTFKDEFMSANHAVVRRPEREGAAGKFAIRDREGSRPSANGTIVNERKLDQGEWAELSDGDRVRVGTTELLFRTLWLPPERRTG